MTKKENRDDQDIVKNLKKSKETRERIIKNFNKAMGETKKHS